MLVLFMPQKNTHKIYYADGFYHVYNRGVEKRDIFQEERDSIVFVDDPTIIKI